MPKKDWGAKDKLHSLSNFLYLSLCGQCLQAAHCCIQILTSIVISFIIITATITESYCCGNL